MLRLRRSPQYNSVYEKIHTHSLIRIPAPAPLIINLVEKLKPNWIFHINMRRRVHCVHIIYTAKHIYIHRHLACNNNFCMNERARTWPERPSCIYFICTPIRHVDVKCVESKKIWNMKCARFTKSFEIKFFWASMNHSWGGETTKTATTIPTIQGSVSSLYSNMMKTSISTLTHTHMPT